MEEEERLTVTRVLNAYETTGLEPRCLAFNVDAIAAGNKPCWGCAITAVLMAEQPFESIVKIFSEGEEGLLDRIAGLLEVPFLYVLGFVMGFDTHPLRESNEYAKLGFEDGRKALLALEHQRGGSIRREQGKS